MAEWKFHVGQIDGVRAHGEVREKGFVMAAPHCHSCYELFYVMKGACSFFIENNMYSIGEGDFLLIPPRMFHYTRYLAGQCKRFNVFFRAEDVGEEEARLMPQGRQFFAGMKIFQVPEAYRTQIENLLLRMEREEKISDERSPLMLSLLFKELLLLCGRECVFLQDMPADIHTTDRQIVRAAQFISERYMDEITTADVAAAAGYSPNYLTRKFREATGTGVHEYIVFVRLERAALELVSTDDSITEVALRCGFSDGNYFKDAFKKRFGVTPRAYRA